MSCTCTECGVQVRIVTIGWPDPDVVVGGHCVIGAGKPGAPPAMLCPGSYEPIEKETL